MEGWGCWRTISLAESKIKFSWILEESEHLFSSFFIALIPGGIGHSNALPPTWSVRAFSSFNFSIFRSSCTFHFHLLCLPTDRPPSSGCWYVILMETSSSLLNMWRSHLILVSLILSEHFKQHKSSRSWIRIFELDIHPCTIYILIRPKLELSNQLKPKLDIVFF